VQSQAGRAAAPKKVKQEARRGRRGKPGRNGQNGPPGVIGTITLVEDNQTINANTPTEAFASCPPGQRVIAGGAYIDNLAGGPDCFLYGSQKAVVVPETWFASGNCPTAQTANLRATAFCVQA
jgi:hypothetical protein